MSCDFCDRRPPDVKLLRCGACKSAFFCSAEHQRAAWPQHRAVCASVQQASQAAAAAAASHDAAAPKAKRFVRPDVKPPAPLSDKQYDPETLFHKLQGLAAFEEEVANTQLMSRFAAGVRVDLAAHSFDATRRDASRFASMICAPAADYFPKNLHYAFSYWDEHAENFAAFLDTMLTRDACVRLLDNATELIMQFNVRYGWIPGDFLPAIKAAYGATLRKRERTHTHRANKICAKNRPTARRNRQR